jgi:hypothetical protein
VVKELLDRVSSTGLPVGPGSGKGGAAGGVVGAVVEQLVERHLALAGDVERHPGVDRHVAVEDGAPHVLRVPAHVDLGGAGAVGAAEEVQPLVAEELPHLVQVIGGDVAGVEGEVGVELARAGAQGGEREEVVQVALEVVLAPRLGAVEGVRAAGAARVDQQDVARGAQPAEELGELGCRRGRGIAGAALEKDQRVGRGIGGLRREDDDVDGDLAPALGRPVLPHRMGAAEHLLVEPGDVARGEALAHGARLCRRGVRWLGEGRGGRRQGEREGEGRAGEPGAVEHRRRSHPSEYAGERARVAGGPNRARRAAVVGCRMSGDPTWRGEA